MNRNTNSSNTNTGMTLTPEYFAQRWSDHMSPRLIKYRLIEQTGRCSAQGDVLRCAGYSDQQLRDITKETADREVARLLGISLAESMLIRIVNDSTGRPQDVFQSPEKVLGPHYRLWRAFAKHIDQMTSQDWDRVVAAWDAAGDKARKAAQAAAWVASGDAARTAARREAGAAVWAAARAAAGDEFGYAAEAAAWTTSWELLGWSQLKEPFFLKMFFDDPRAWAKSIEEEDGGAA